MAILNTLSEGEVILLFRTGLAQAIVLGSHDARFEFDVRLDVTSKLFLSRTPVGGRSPLAFIPLDLGETVSLLHVNGRDQIHISFAELDEGRAGASYATVGYKIDGDGAAAFKMPERAQSLSQSMTNESGFEFDLYLPATEGAMDAAVDVAKQALKVAARAAAEAAEAETPGRWHNNPPPEFLVNDEAETGVLEALEIVQRVGKGAVLTSEVQRAFAELGSAVQRLVDWAAPFAKQGAENGVRDGVKLGVMGIIGSAGLLAGGAISWAIALAKQLLGIG